MKLKNKQKLWQQTPKELLASLQKSQQDLVDLRLKISLGKHKNVHAASQKRREIAVIKTILSQKKFLSESKSTQEKSS